MSFEITCGSCWQIFSADSARAKYCSELCFYQKRKTGAVIPCAQCGYEKYFTRGKLRTNKPLFCGAQCANAWQGRNKLRYLCKICGNEFKRSPSSLKYENPKYCSIVCRDKDPELLDILRKRSLAQKTKVGPTSIELIGRQILTDLGAEFFEQHTINDRFCVDAFIPAAGLVVQFDGDWWHGHPERYPVPTAVQRRAQGHDKACNAYLQACGFEVVRVWETDLRKRPEIVKARLRTSMNARLECRSSTAS